MTDPLQSARVLLEKRKSPTIDLVLYESCAAEALNMLPAIIAEAEQWRAMAIREHAITIAYENNMQLCECEDYAMCYARRELATEAGSWKKIGPEKQAAIENTILVLQDYEANSEIQIGDVAPLIAVLRKLLESAP